MIDMEKLAGVWRKMQDERDRLAAECKKADDAIKKQQDAVGDALLAAMTEMGGDSLKTEAGVVERKRSMKPSAADWGAVYRFVVENDAFELLHKRLSSTFVEKYAKEHDALPPGINVYTEFKVTVKKPGAKSLPADQGEEVNG